MNQLYGYIYLGFPGGSAEKKPPEKQERDTGSIPGSGRSPGEGNGKLLQYSCLENPEEPGRLHPPWGHKESDMTEQLHSLFTNANNVCCGFVIYSFYLFKMTDYVISLTQ